MNLDHVLGLTTGEKFLCTAREAGELNNDRNGRGERNIDFRNGMVFRNRAVSFAMPVELYKERAFISDPEKEPGATAPTAKPETYKSIQQANYYRRINGMNDTHTAVEQDDGSWVLQPNEG